MSLPTEKEMNEWRERALAIERCAFHDEVHKRMLKGEKGVVMAQMSTALQKEIEETTYLRHIKDPYGGGHLIKWD